MGDVDVPLGMNHDLEGSTAIQELCLNHKKNKNSNIANQIEA
jgi:hypothetical protein